jgi:hypothetical protein
MCKAEEEDWQMGGGFYVIANVLCLVAVFVLSFIPICQDGVS